MFIFRTWILRKTADTFAFNFMGKYRFRFPATVYQRTSKQNKKIIIDSRE